MSYLKPRCQKISLHESCTTQSPVRISSHEPSFVFASLEGCFRNTSLIFSTLIFYLIYLHPFILLPTASFSPNNTFPPLLLAVLSGYSLSPLPSQPPFDHAGKGRGLRTRPPPPPLLRLPSSQRSSCPRQGRVPSSPLAWGHAEDIGPSRGETPSSPLLLHRYAWKPSPSLL